MLGIIRYLRTFGFKQLFTIIAIVSFCAICVTGYNYINNKFIALEKATELIKNQSIIITDLNNQLKLLQESNKITVKSLNQLEDKKVIIKERIVKHIEVITEKIEAIKTDDNILDKDKEISIVYIDSLNETYCTVSISSCNSDKKAP